jgi:hypothetical protein
MHRRIGISLKLNFPLMKSLEKISRFWIHGIDYLEDKRDVPEK